MPHPRPSESEDTALVEAANRHRHPDGRVNTTALADEVGEARSTIQSRLNRMAREGTFGYKAILPGFAIKSTSELRDSDGNIEKTWVKQSPLGEQFEMPHGHVIKGISAFVDEQGATIAKWIKTREGPNADDAIAAIKTAFEDYAPAAPASPIPTLKFSDCLTLFPLPDMHIGMFSWGEGNRCRLGIEDRAKGHYLRDGERLRAHGAIKGSGRSRRRRRDALRHQRQQNCQVGQRSSSRRAL